MISDLILYMLISVILLYMFYRWVTVHERYFVQRSMKFCSPKFLFGNTIGLFLKLYTPTDFVDSIYYRFPREKLIGFFDVREPVYLARDIDFISQITIKDFEHFEDDIGFIECISDTLFGKSLFLLSETQWRDMRATLSPTIVGHKMQHVFDLVAECADNTVKHLIDVSKQGKPVRWEMKELFSRYTTDAIALCAFGLKVNSFKDRKNEFFTIGTSSPNVRTLKVALRLFLSRTLPKLMRAINIEFFPAHFKEFFKSMVADTMEERKKKQLLRPDDVINILMQVRGEKVECKSDKINEHKEIDCTAADESYISIGQVKQSWTDDEILAQCFLFLATGFETAATLMAFMAYELALNQDVQQKLYKKIQNANASLNGDRLSYDTLSKLKYLDQALSECLRKWPPVIFATRKCVKDYEYDLNGDKIVIERGRSVWIPIYSLHHDDQIYTNPKLFNPERFSDENKHKIKPCAYIPFGTGPKNSIGSRFALMEIKAMYFYLVLNFKIRPYDKTQIPLKMAKSVTTLSSEKGIHLELIPRV